MYLKTMTHDVRNKLHKFQCICSTIRRNLQNSRKITRMKFFETIAIPTLLHRSETWALTKIDDEQVQSSEIKCLESVKKCLIMDEMRNNQIRKELEIKAILNKMKNYRRK